MNLLTERTGNKRTLMASNRLDCSPKIVRLTNLMLDQQNIRKMAFCSMLLYFEKDKLLKLYTDQLKDFFNIHWTENDDLKVILLLDRNRFILNCFKNDSLYFWSTLDKIMIRIDESSMYCIRSVDNDLFEMVVKRKLCFNYFNDKVFSEFCNHTELVKSCRNKIKSDCHDLFVSLCALYSLYHPFAKEALNLLNDTNCNHSLFQNDDIQESAFVDLNICGKILTLIIRDGCDNLNDTSIANIFVELRHLAVISGKLTYNTGLFLCTVIRTLLTSYPGDLKLFRWLRFFWEELIEYPFIANDCDGSIPNDKLSHFELKNCLRLFAALTTFIPLSLYKNYKEYEYILVNSDLKLFYASQDMDLSSLRILQKSASEVLNSVPLNKNLYLCILGSYSSVLTNWWNGRFDVVSIGSEKIRLRVALLPADLITSCISIVNYGTKHVSLGAYTPCILLSCFVFRLLNTWFTHFEKCLKCCYRRETEIFISIVARMNEMKMSFDQILVKMSISILPNWKRLLWEHQDKNTHKLYETVLHASILFEKLIVV
jgi:hypothetical protein